MPPSWIPFVVLSLIIAWSALRLWLVTRQSGVNAYGFGRQAAIQGVAERLWRLAVLAALALSAVAWLAPDLEAALGRPDWALFAPLRWVSAILFVAALAIIAVAQIQMGASWRVGVPKEGPGELVSRGLFAWSRNPIFVGLLAALAALLLWSPTVMSAAVLAGAWTLTLVQVRIEEEALREKHGDRYELYAARVGRWFGRRALPWAGSGRVSP
jgi:protein-S-isoprenylcysteine O-methyltransferase Ste14